MKPAPRQKHLSAILILAVVAGVQTYLACLDNRLSPPQVHMVTARISRHTPDALSQDPTFGGRGISQRDKPLNSPFRQFWAEAMLTDESGLHPHVAFGIAAGVLAMTYLCGMYFLLVRQCQVWSLAVFVAVCSLGVADTLGNAYWGIGALGSATGEGLFIAATPWLVLGLLCTAETWLMIPLFAMAGLLGNAYVPGAVNLTIVLAAGYLFSRPLTLRRAGLAGLCVAAALGALVPAWWHHVDLVRSLPPDGAAAGAHEAMDAMAAGSLRVGYAEMLDSLLNWVILALVLILALVVTLGQTIRHRVRDRVLWLWMLGGALALAVPVHCLCLLAGSLRSAPPPAIDFIRASSVAMLPLYVFFAEALVALFHTLPSSRRLLRVSCGVLLVAWFAGSDNVRIARHAFLDAATMFLDEESRPANVRRHREADLARGELTAIALWARDQKHTQSVFLIDPAHGAVFRMISRRAVVAARDDVLYIYHVAPHRLGRWHRRSLDLAALLVGKTTDGDIRAAIAAWRKAGLFQHVSKWYLVRRADEPALTDLEEVSGAGWGKVYRLFEFPG